MRQSHWSKPDYSTYLACACSEEAILNSLNELDQLRVLRIFHGAVEVSHWVDPNQTVREEGKGQQDRQRAIEALKQNQEKIQYAYTCSVHTAHLHTYMPLCVHVRALTSS